MPSSPRVLVVGAGLTGLTLAFRLVAAGLSVRIVERLSRTGGQIHSVASDDAGVIELGAEGFVARSEALVALSRDVGLGDALLDQATTLTYALEADGRLRALADGEAARILGFQVRKDHRGRGLRSQREVMGHLT
ncbi:MAG: FAD-dependent oxidoreductase, partial [Myxococcota bacterium]